MVVRRLLCPLWRLLRASDRPDMVSVPRRRSSTAEKAPPPPPGYFLEKVVAESLPPIPDGKPPPPGGEEHPVYARRWLILAIFVLYSTVNGMQWVQFSIISNIVQRYYGVSSFAVDMSSLCFMIIYFVLICPVSWMLDKWGLRVVVIVGMVLTSAGAWVKVAAVSPDLFYVAFIGQALVGVGNAFILSLPSRLAAVWFGPGEVSTACAIGVFGNQLGGAVGFTLSPTIVHDSANLNDISRDLAVLFYSVSACCTLLLAVILLLFKDAPPLPPSAAQAALKDIDSPPDFAGSLRRLLTNPSYVLLLLAYGIMVGVYYVLSILLNTIILRHYEGAVQDAGRIGLVIIVSGMIGSAAGGFVLDKTRKFKETTFVLYLCALVGMLAFTFTLNSGKIIVVYVTSGVLGFFMTGFLPVGFELAAELTYPEPEGTSSGLLNGSVQVFAIAMTLGYAKLIEYIDDWWANVILCGLLALGTVFTSLIKSDLRRQAAAEGKKKEELPPVSIIYEGSFTKF
ncbi:heme transporter FLVCR2-like [Bacillus rossius redtenbacheri]|uniref:heme transporter FLVCR2-like n=1 Tax=Bacillus rossius redtenbacheri TaxID=93214 RepID=UPI002FDD5190